MGWNPKRSALGARSREAFIPRHGTREAATLPGTHTQFRWTNGPGLWLNPARTMTRDGRQDPPLVLASASARRQKILAGLGVRFATVRPPDDELSGGLPADLVRLNAGRKMTWGRATHPRCRILTADTVVVFSGRILGKPVDNREARGWFRDFSGKSQDVLTGVAYLDRLGVLHEDVVKSVVVFKTLSESVIEEYLALVNPLDKAGGYDIDDRGELIVERWEGSRSNIMGLPAERVSCWFREDGVL